MDDIIIDIGAANSSAIGLTINDLIISVFEYTLYNGEFVLQLNNSNKPVLDISRDVIVYLLPQMSQPNTNYRLLCDLVFDTFVFIQMPAGCKIDFMHHSMHNCALISNQTRVINLPCAYNTVKGKRSFEVAYNQCNFEILGKIFNYDGDLITLHEQIINRNTELLYNYTPHINATFQYDGAINNYARRARRLGLNDCLIMVPVIKEQYELYNKNIDEIINPEQNSIFIDVVQDNNIQKVADFGQYYIRKKYLDNEQFDEAASVINVLDKFKYGTNNTTYGASITGGWGTQGYINTPKDLVAEMYLNGLSVRGIKFHADHWEGSIQEYCSFILQYVTVLKNEILDFNSDQLNQDGLRSNIQMFTEVYIANEMHVWTAEHCTAATILADLATSLHNLGFNPQISFAGKSDMFGCDHNLYDLVTPNLNFYPKLSYQPITNFSNESYENNNSLYGIISDYIDGFVADENLGEFLIQQFKAIDTFWQGRYSFDNTRQVALSEVGVRPCQNSLRATSNSQASYIGNFNECVMPIYWKALRELARKVPFKYMVVFFLDWVYDNSSSADLNSSDPDVVVSKRTNARIEERMYDIFTNFI